MTERPLGLDDIADNRHGLYSDVPETIEAAKYALSLEARLKEQGEARVKQAQAWLDAEAFDKEHGGPFIAGDSAIGILLAGEAEIVGRALSADTEAPK